MPKLSEFPTLTGNNNLVQGGTYSHTEHNAWRRKLQDLASNLNVAVAERERNFSGTSEPEDTVNGKLWYDSGNKVLKARINGLWETIITASAYPTILVHKNGFDQVFDTRFDIFLITWNAESWDTGGEFTPSQWTCVTPGTYVISAHVSWAITGGFLNSYHEISVGLQRNGNIIAQSFDSALPGSSQGGISLNSIIKADTGEVYRLNWYGGFSAPQTITTLSGIPAHTWLSIARIA